MKIIAESAFNHNGDLKYLKDLASASKRAGADYFTVQIYSTEEFCTKDYSKYEICKNVELSKTEWELFFQYASEFEVNVLPCILDINSLEFCLSKGFEVLKIHATDLLNLPLLKRISETEIRVLLETQCATSRDIDESLKIINDNVSAIFVGYSNYPTEFDDLNLDSLDFIKKKWNKEVGLADHTLDTLGIPAMALAKGCSYLEKHITLNRSNRNYDWQVSLEEEDFSIMVQNIKKYRTTLGSGMKHPVKNERKFRDVMYKKYLVDSDQSEVEVKRADEGLSYYEYKYSKYPSNRVVTAVIARLKSTRLPQKVLKPFLNKNIIVDLLHRVSSAEKIYKTVLATSYLDEDKKLADVVKVNGFEVYLGHPISVIDRMLDIAEKYEASSIFRVTGDNPLTDPTLMDAMVNLMSEHKLDYVRANNVPFGISGELFSTKYLMKLFQGMDDPLQSEYLTWYVLLEDEGRKGCIDINCDIEELYKYNLSIDYEEDYDRNINLLKAIKKNDVIDITLRDIVNNIEEFQKVNMGKEIKLPGTNMKYYDYMNKLNQADYITRKRIEV